MIKKKYECESFENNSFTLEILKTLTRIQANIKNKLTPCEINVEFKGSIGKNNCSYYFRIQFYCTVGKYSYPA